MAPPHLNALLHEVNRPQSMLCNNAKPMYLWGGVCQELGDELIGRWSRLRKAILLREKASTLVN